MLTGRSDLDPDQIFAPFDLTRRPALIAAVSGGSDSLAMLLLLQDWLKRHAPAMRLVAITVDHMLRPEARAEADDVARFCAARGIAHRIVAWTGDKPATGVAAAARMARYRLLSEAAAAEGAEIVVTGHTADDQAETVAMRQVRGDGRGLAGMAPVTLYDGRTWIVRPLLTTGRARLCGFLRGEGVAWLEDPTNTDARHERARTRFRLAGADGRRVDELLAIAEAAGKARVAAGRCAAELIERHATRPMQGLMHLAPGFAANTDEEATLLALRALLAVTGGVEQLPDAGRARALLDRLRTGRVRATLSRAVVDARKSGLVLYRERRGLPEGPVGRCVAWDGRYDVLADNGAESAHVPLSVSPVGRDGEGADRPDGVSEEVMKPLTVPASIENAVRATMPQLNESAMRVVPVLAPWRLFLPSFDLLLAQAIARLIGAPKIPEPPLTGHNGEEG